MVDYITRQNKRSILLGFKTISGHNSIEVEGSIEVGKQLFASLQVFVRYLWYDQVGINAKKNQPGPSMIKRVSGLDYLFFL
jgi:hypothetical protein